MRGLGLIPEGVDVGENMILTRSLRIVSITQVINSGLYTEVIEDKN